MLSELQSLLARPQRSTYEPWPPFLHGLTHGIVRENPELASNRNVLKEAGYDTDLGLHGLGAASNTHASFENIYSEGRFVDITLRAGQIAMS